jgi:translation initiation factor 3 subunit D
MIRLIEENKADIYSTDSVIAALMCSTRSNYSWDIEI